MPFRVWLIDEFNSALIILSYHYHIISIFPFKSKINYLQNQDKSLDRPSVDKVSVLNRNSSVGKVYVLSGNSSVGRVYVLNRNSNLGKVYSNDWEF